MENEYKIDRTRVECELNSFKFYADYRNNNSQGNYIDFRNKSIFPGNEEEYKVEVAKEAEKALNFEKWDESQIGTGKICDCVCKAMTVKSYFPPKPNQVQNLVYHSQQTYFIDRCSKYPSASERALFDIYHGSNDEEAFKQAVETFGAKYDLIAYLFYIKGPEKYLPVRPSFFENGLKRLGIDYEMCGKCSWKNYKVFIDIIKEIQQIMNECLPLKEANSVRLIDAHSFVWIISQAAYVDWTPDHEYAIEMGLYSDNCQSPKSGAVKKSVKNITSYNRDSAVAKKAKKQANGVCQLCGNPAPFNDNDGQPYLEAHHIQWLSQGGSDTDKNVVALCPNCHRKMHIINDSKDRDKLIALKDSNHNQKG